MLDQYNAILIYIDCENDIKSENEILQFIDKHDNCFLGKKYNNNYRIHFDLKLVVIDIAYFELIHDEYNTDNILKLFILVVNLNLHITVLDVTFEHYISVLYPTHYLT